MVDIIISSLVLYVIVSLIFYAVALRSKIKKSTVELTQCYLDKEELSKFVRDSLAADSGAEAQAKEDFVTFLSQSRDWAYKYIEDVQGSLTDFRNEVEGVIVYWEDYGDIISTPHDENIKKVIKAYRELIKVLPEGESK